MLINPADTTDYETGFRQAQGGAPLVDSAPYWQREGWNQAAARWTRINLVVGAVPPAFQPFTPVTATEVATYLSGFQGSMPPLNPGDWWYRVGEWDRKFGRAARALLRDVPPPAFNEVNPNAPPPVFGQQPGQPPPADIFRQPWYQLTPGDLDDYESGWQAAATGTVSPYTAWWSREGYASQKAGRAKILPDGTTFWLGRALLEVREAQAYADGFRDGPKTTIDSPNFRASLPFWYRQGIADAKSGRGLQNYQGTFPPVGFPVVVNRAAAPLPSGPVPTVPNIGGPTVEVLATLFGKPVPYDLAASIGHVETSGFVPALLAFGTNFRLIGDAPGSQREGYRLSGPNGPIARKVAQGIARGWIKPDPRLYQLPAWVGTHLRNGSIKLLGRGELQSLGLWEPLLDLYAAPFSI